MKTILSLFTFIYSLDRSSVFISELSLVSGTSNCSVSLCYMDRCPVAIPGSQNSVANCDIRFSLQQNSLKVS